MFKNHKLNYSNSAIASMASMQPMHALLLFALCGISRANVWPMPSTFANGSSVATVDPAKMQLFLADGNATAMVKAELAVAFERFQRNAFPHAGAKSSAGAVGAVRPRRPRARAA